MLDLTGYLRRIMNTDVNETFAQATDSLEAIRDFIAMGGATGGLAFYGVVTAVPGANQFTIPTLAGLGAGKFDGALNPYWAFVFRDAAGGAAAPQGEHQPVTAYNTATGAFTTTPFTAAVGVGDEIILASPYIAAIGLLFGEQPGALGYLGQCPAGMAASLNTITIPGLTWMPAQTFTRGYQMIVLHNNNAVANPPEMEKRNITNFGAGVFTTANFSANVEELDIVLVVHNEVAKHISVYGIADAGSDADTLLDAARVEANDYWNGQTLLMLSGNNRGLARPIVDYAVGAIEVRPAFPGVIADGDLYAVLDLYHEIVPVADSGENYQPRDVGGNKADAAVAVVGVGASLMAYIKGIVGILGPLQQGLCYYGVVTNIPGANQFDIAVLAGLGNAKFQAMGGEPYRAFVLRDAGGAAAAPQGEIQNITGYVSATGRFTTNAFTAAVAVNDEILIIHPRAAESAVVAMRGGAETLESLDDELDVILDLARSPQSATTTTDGALQTLYNSATDAMRWTPFYYGGSEIDLTNMGPGNTILLRLSIVNRAAGAFVQKSDDLVNTYSGVQTEPIKQFPGFYNQYGVRLQMQLLAGANIDIYHEHFDARRGS